MTDIPDAAAVQAAIERNNSRVHDHGRDRSLVGIEPARLADLETLADACEHYQREIAAGLNRITVRCRGCHETASAIFETQAEAFDFSDQFDDSHATKCGRWTSHCNYCGHTAQGTKQEAIEQSKSHDLVCEKSPLAEMRAELETWHAIHGTENASEVAEALKHVRIQRDDARAKLAAANAALDRIGDEQTREAEELRMAYEKQLAAALARERGLREALLGAKSFIENLKVPQTLSDAAEQVRQGMHCMNGIEAALAEPKP